MQFYSEKYNVDTVDAIMKKHNALKRTTYKSRVLSSALGTIFLHTTLSSAYPAVFLLVSPSCTLGAALDFLQLQGSLPGRHSLELCTADKSIRRPLFTVLLPGESVSLLTNGIFSTSVF